MQLALHEGAIRSPVNVPNKYNHDINDNTPNIWQNGPLNFDILGSVSEIKLDALLMKQCTQELLHAPSLYVVPVMING